MLYNFCSEDNCADGRTPHGTLIIDAQGNLYGTTLYGGEEEGGLGVAFRLEHTAGGWELVNIHNFCGADAPIGAEECLGGATAAGGLTYAGAATGAPYDGASPLYGASMEGGEGKAGIVFQLTPRKEGTRAKDGGKAPLTQQRADGKFLSKRLLEALLEGFEIHGGATS